MKIAAEGSFSDGLRMNVFPHAMAFANIHIGTIAGEVERGDAGHDAERLSDLIDVDARACLLAEPALEEIGDAAGELEVLGPRAISPKGIGWDLAVLGSEERGERVTALVDQVADLEHDVGPLCSDVARQAGNAVRAAATAASTSRSTQSRRASSWPVAGSKTSTEPEVPSTRRPPIQCRMRLGFEARGDIWFSDLGHRRVLVSGVDPSTIRQNGGRVSGSGQAGAVAPSRARDRRGRTTPISTASVRAPTAMDSARMPPAGSGPATIGSRQTVVTAARTRHQAAIATSKRVPSRGRKMPSELAARTATRPTSSPAPRRPARDGMARSGRATTRVRAEVGGRPVAVEEATLPAAEDHGQLPADDRGQQRDRCDVRQRPTEAGPRRSNRSRGRPPPRAIAPAPTAGSTKDSGPARNASGTSSA